MTNFIPEVFINRSYDLIESLQQQGSSASDLDKRIKEATVFLRTSQSNIASLEDAIQKEICFPVLHELEAAIDRVSSAAGVQFATLRQAPARLEINCLLKPGNTLYIRGDQKPLSWERGVPLTQERPGVWTLDKPLKPNAEYKLLDNDEEWEELDGNRRVSSTGELNDTAPKFPAMFLEARPAAPADQGGITFYTFNNADLGDIMCYGADDVVSASIAHPIAAVQSAPQTQAPNRLMISCLLKPGNTLYIRGDQNPELSWSCGAPLRQESPGVWTLDRPLKPNAEYKLLVNDKYWEELDGNRRVSSTGELNDTAPKFPAEFLEVGQSVTGLQNLTSPKEVETAATGLATLWKIQSLIHSDQAQRAAITSFDADCLQWGMQNLITDAENAVKDLRALNMGQLASQIEAHLPALQEKYQQVLSRSILMTLDNDHAILAETHADLCWAVMAERLNLHKRNLAFIKESSLPIAAEAVRALQEAIQVIESNLTGFNPSAEQRQTASDHIKARNLVYTLTSALRADTAERFRSLSTHERDFFILHYFDELKYDVDSIKEKLAAMDPALARHLKELIDQFQSGLLPELLKLSFQGTWENDQHIAREIRYLQGQVDPQVIEKITTDRIAITENNAKYEPRLTGRVEQVKKLFQ